jgi:hypothetical protein
MLLLIESILADVTITLFAHLGSSVTHMKDETPWRIGTMTSLQYKAFSHMREQHNQPKWVHPS